MCMYIYIYIYILLRSMFFRQKWCNSIEATRLFYVIQVVHFLAPDLSHFCFDSTHVHTRTHTYTHPYLACLCFLQ
ncbi:hypothetical protein FKM82_012207 [Ascaphus truei]